MEELVDGHKRCIAVTCEEHAKCVAKLPSAPADNEVNCRGRDVAARGECWHLVPHIGNGLSFFAVAPTGKDKRQRQHKV